jgi:hypothetical protein
MVYNKRFSTSFIDMTTSASPLATPSTPTFPDAEQIASMPTRQLLAQLDKARAISSSGTATASDEKAFNELQGRLKTELATREHVPGTLESKQARQARQARPEKKTLRY